MRKFHVVDGTPPPDSPAEQVRAKHRSRRQPNMPQCSYCAGREYVTARIGTVQSKLCVVCLMQGQRRVMS